MRLRFIRNNPIALMLILLMAWQTISGGRFSSPLDWLMSTMIILPGILIGLSFHEYAHAKAAALLGDDTPKVQGRVTINPAAHVDPIGFIALLFIGFGWGKPVQVNPNNFKHMRRDGLIVDLAGVVMNLFIAIITAGILRLLLQYQFDFMNTYMGGVVSQIIMAIISINIVLMVFNLLPIPPLDGFGIVTEIFNLREKPIYYTLYNNGFLILMVLLIFNITDVVLVPVVKMIYQWIIGIFF